MMMAVAALAVSSCFKAPEEQGFLGENIYLQGGDTLFVALGATKSTDKAWLDNSTKPCVFKIENVRDEEGNRHEGFFQKFPTRIWNTPYDYLTDSTEQQVLDKLTYFDMTPLMINEVNGQLSAMSSTGEIGIEPGQVFHVDVSVTNPKGTRYVEDYAIIKFEKGKTSEQFVCHELINGICIEADMTGKNQIQHMFPYYEQINDSKSNWATLQQDIYDGKEVAGMTIKRISETPEVGIKFILRFVDESGKMFDPAQYATFTTNTSFITHGVNRENTENGMEVSFPYTPWPVTNDAVHLGYMRGPYYSNLGNVDLEDLKANFNKHVASNSYAGWPSTTGDNAAYPKDTYPEIHEEFWTGPDNNLKPLWPSDEWLDEHVKGWFVRLRSRFKFHQPGTYELVIKVPYVTAQ